MFRPISRTKPFIITESNSALMTRGYYRMPSDRMFIWPERWDQALCRFHFCLFIL